MKKILIVLAVIGFAQFSAEAQTSQINVCGVKNNQVCKLSSNKKTAYCYKTEYAENFKVCKGDMGYYICCETPNATNSTYPAMLALGVKKYPAYALVHDRYQERYDNNGIASADMVAPQSQSYPANTGFGMNGANSYEGYYPRKNYIRVCYGGDNVAELNRAPYHGCPSPAYEGPNVNKVRNINANNGSYDLPPLEGRSHE